MPSLQSQSDGSMHLSADTLNQWNRGDPARGRESKSQRVITIDGRSTWKELGHCMFLAANETISKLTVENVLECMPGSGTKSVRPLSDTNRKSSLTVPGSFPTGPSQIVILSPPDMACRTRFGLRSGRILVFRACGLSNKIWPVIQVRHARSAEQRPILFTWMKTSEGGVRDRGGIQIADVYEGCTFPPLASK
jgi:hypothetical protein